MNAVGYDPQSNDAMFATILQRMTSIEGTLARIEGKVDKTNGRVTKLEGWRAVLTARVSLIASFVSASVAAAVWLLRILFA
jgi:hypothetical protein